MLKTLNFSSKIQSLSPLKYNALCYLLGGGGALAFQPVNLTVCFFIGFLGFYHLFETRPFKKKWQIFFSGWWFGLGYFVGGLYWISFALHVNWTKFGWLFPFALLGIPSFLALASGFTTLGASYFKKEDRWTRLGIFIILWSSSEWIRGNLFTGFPWLNAAEIWLAYETIPQFLSLTGVYGLGLLTLLGVACLYGLFFIRESAKGGLKTIFCLLVGAGSILFFGLNRLNNAHLETYSDFDLVIVQPNIPQIYKWDRGYFDQNIEILRTLSQVPSSKPRVILWPEASVPYELTSDSRLARYLTQDLKEGDFLILGGFHYRYDDLGRLDGFYNSIFVLNAQGQILETYDKCHLVPFGEYVPFRPWLPSGIASVAAGMIDCVPGKGLTTVKLTETIPPFSPLVCYEAIFSGEVISSHASTRPQWLLNLTNDGWYLHSSGPYQHLHLVRMRAIEEGIPLVRVVYKGISAVFDPYGRTYASIPYGKAEGLKVSLPKPLKAPTFYSLYGQTIYFIMLLTFFLGIVMRAALLKRRRSSSEQSSK